MVAMMVAFLVDQLYLKDEMTLKSAGPIVVYPYMVYEP